jgi:hypothetical protein
MRVTPTEEEDESIARWTANRVQQRANVPTRWSRLPRMQARCLSLWPANEQPASVGQTQTITYRHNNSERLLTTANPARKARQSNDASPTTHPPHTATPTNCRPKRRTRPSSLPTTTCLKRRVVLVREKRGLRAVGVSAPAVADQFVARAATRVQWRGRACWVQLGGVAAVATGDESSQRPHHIQKKGTKHCTALRRTCTCCTCMHLHCTCIAPPYAAPQRRFLLIGCAAWAEL